MTYTPTPATTAARHQERISYDEALAHEVLDSTVLCSVATVVGGLPRVLPQLHVRRGSVLHLHASSGATTSLAARDGGVDVSVAVSQPLALVLARSAVHHSIDSRSVVVAGRAVPVTDPAEKRAVLAALVDAVAPGRSAQCRPPTERELAMVGVLALPLVMVSVKVRAHGAVDDDADLALPHWAGRVPLRLVAGEYEPAPDLHPDIPAPPRHPLQLAVT